MNSDRVEITEQLQVMVVRLIATSPAGQGIALIGGFRYRFLDRGVRRSLDIDYHCESDLDERQDQLVRLFTRRLLPDVRRSLRLSGTAAHATGPGADSPIMRTVNLAFWGDTPTLGRIELPVEITRIVCLDPPEVRTADGVVYATPSDADLIEAKLIAIINRTFLQHRDLVDLHLFANHLREDSPQRLGGKMDTLSIPPTQALARLSSLTEGREGHARILDTLISEQLDSTAGAALRTAGGGQAVMDHVLAILRDQFRDVDR